MAFAQTWLLVACFALQQCSASPIYPREPPADGAQTVHLHLEEPIIEFSPQPPPKIYPLSPEELKEFYSSRLPKKHLRNSKFPSVSKLKPKPYPGPGKKCCGYKGGGFYEGRVPVVRPGNGRHTDQLQNYRSPHVKPVVEHIEGDLKYDFRTKTHSF